MFLLFLFFFFFFIFIFMEGYSTVGSDSSLVIPTLLKYFKKNPIVIILGFMGKVV